jgi:acetylornithine aminotransferase
MAGVIIAPFFTPVVGQLGTTFGGNHLACAGACAVLDIIKEENLVDNAAKVGNYLLSELKKIDRIKEVRGKGLMLGIEFNEPVAPLRQKLLYDKHIFTGVAGQNMIRLLAPLCLTKAEADRLLTAFSEVLA